MQKIYTSAEQLIGNTPLLELTHIQKKFNITSRIFAKLEYLNPAGSAKDRIALSMIEDAEISSKLKPNSTIIEPTSGNTGIGLALIAATRGYKLIIVMPENMSIERQQLMYAYGADLVLTDKNLGMKGAIQKAEELAKQIPNSFIPRQFDNPANPKAHFLTTGPEIWQDLEGAIDYFVAGVGTGGTLSGCGKYLKSKNPNIKVIAVEPEDSPLLSRGVAGAHGIQGIGANFIPSTLDTSIYDRIISVKTEDAYDLGRQIAKTEGILVGISSGAVLWAALQLANEEQNSKKNIVALLPDTGDRYLSTPMFMR